MCDRAGLNLKSLDEGNRKRKFLVKYLPDDQAFPNFQELNVVHNYLSSTAISGQVRLRKSGQNGNWSYSYAVRDYEEGQIVETRTQIDRREYAVIIILNFFKRLIFYRKKQERFKIRFDRFKINFGNG